MRESDEQFLERFIDEIQPAIEPLGRITGARLAEETAAGRRIRIEVSVDGRIGPIELILEGESLIEAAAGWEARIAEARLALAFREVVRA
jgi:hypothetical protein